MKQLLILLILLMISCGRETIVEQYKGIDGTNGTNGDSCKVSQLQNGALIQCGETTSIVYNGIDGKTIVQNNLKVFNPCPATNNFDEVFLQMEDGTLIAFFTDGKNERLSILQKGVTYRSTDTRINCIFTLNLDGSITLK